MAKTTKSSSTSFKIFEVSENVRWDNREKVTIESEIRETSLEQSFSDLNTDNRSTRITRFPRRTKPNETHEQTTSTTTPETSKVSLPVPDAPVKPPRKPKNIDMRPKRLQFTEESENPMIMDSVIDPNDTAMRYATRSSSRNITENFIPTGSTAKHAVQPARKIFQKNLPEVDKENAGINANSRQIDRPSAPIDRVTSKKCNTQKKSTKLMASQNRLKSEESKTDNEEQPSPCDPNCGWEDTLRWLQPRRDIGLWIQCCRDDCQKWRYNELYHDPTDVPEIWYCHMNPNPSLASCSQPEEVIPPDVAKDIVQSEYNAGSIVWAKLRGHPWWPAMVDDSPSTFLYYQLGKDSTIPIKYNVTYFGTETAQCSWIPVKDLRMFKTNPKKIFLRGRRMVYGGISYKDQVSRACELADKALPLSISERLARFSFVALQKCSPDGRNKDDDEESNCDEISSTILSQLTVDDEIVNEELGKVVMDEKEPNGRKVGKQVSDEKELDENDVGKQVSDEKKSDGKKVSTKESRPKREQSNAGFGSFDRVKKIEPKDDEDKDWPFPPNAATMSFDMLLKICNKHEKPFL